LPTLNQLFCCLNPDERGAMRGTALLFLESLGTVVPFVLFDVLWLPLIPSRESRRDAFVAGYGLSKVELPFGEPPVMTELLQFDNLTFWTDVLVMVLLPGGACLDGCSLCVPYPCAP